MIDNQKPIYKIQPDKIATIRLAGYGLLLTFIGFGIISAISSNTSAGNGILILVAYVGTLLLHEAIHGLFFKVFGGNPTFGVGITHFMPYAYATSKGEKFSFGQMSVVALSPFIIISIICIGGILIAPNLAPYWTIAFVGNFAGAVGDLWIWTMMSRFRHFSDVIFEDLADGIAVYSDDPGAKRRADSFKEKQSRSSFIHIWIISSLIVLFITILVTVALTMLDIRADFKIGPASFPLIEYSNSSDGLETGFSFIPALAGGLIFAVFYKIFTKKT